MLLRSPPPTCTPSSGCEPLRGPVLPAAAKALRKLVTADRTQAQAIAAAVIGLASDPRPDGKKVKALAGRPGQLRLRVGDYRVIYTVQDGHLVVLVLQLGHRRDIYG